MNNFAPSDTFGNTYVPQYFSYDLDEANFKPALTRRDTQLAISLNFKENGITETAETQNGQQFFGTTGTGQPNKRFAFRKAFSLGAIAPNGNETKAHGISGATIFTHVYGGVITATPDFRPLPHASVTANANIEVIVTATQYIVNNGAGGPAITSGILVLEYLKQ